MCLKSLKRNKFITSDPPWEMGLAMFAHGILALTVIFGCSVSLANEPENLEQVKNVKSNWEMAGLLNYSYKLKKGGVFGYSLYKVSVKHGVCTAKSKSYFGRSSSNWKKVSCDGIKIDDLIDSAVFELERGAIKADLVLDIKNNLISRFVVEPNTQLTDQDWYFEVLEFRKK